MKHSTTSGLDEDDDDDLDGSEVGAFDENTDLLALQSSNSGSSKDVVGLDEAADSKPTAEGVHA